jgi:hypothetical protein
VRTLGCVRADAPCFILGNFKKDATVRLSHGRPRGHRPSVRPSVRPSENVRMTTMWKTISCAEIAMGHIQPIDAGDSIE